MNKLLALVLLCAASLAASPAAEKPSNPEPAEPPAKGYTDSPAGKPHIYKTIDGRELKMDIFFPPKHDAARVPGLILFHGGGWTGGTPDQFRYACNYFASRGLVCATVQYRFGNKAAPGESNKRICVTDAKSAIRWFKQHAAELGGDPARIITGGGSAGGHISALATLNPGLNDPSDPKDIDTSVVAYRWYNTAFAPNDDKEVNVLQYLKADLPPAISFFGDKDSWKKGWDVAYAKWKALGTKSIDLQIAPGQSHSFFNKEPWRAATLIAADKFLVKLGLLSGEPTLPAPSEKLVPTP